jgi:hypothetical protein
MLSTRSQDVLSATVSLVSESILPAAEWMVETEWFANGNICFLLVIFLAARAADVRGRAIKDTVPPISPPPS